MINKKVAILQSNYIPWKGYFDIINSVDAFVVYDEVQYTKNDWRNRNMIKTPGGLSWLTIPVAQASLNQRIDETRAVDNRWRQKHWKSLQAVYSKAPYFKQLSAALEDLFLASVPGLLLSDINRSFIQWVCGYLEIKTPIISSVDLKLEGNRMERLVDACRKLNGEVYLSGPAAKQYLDETLFAQKGISVEWMDYTGYPEYPQLYPPFVHGVSILDLLFHAGPDAPLYMKSFNKR